MFWATQLQVFAYPISRPFRLVCTLRDALTVFAACSQQRSRKFIKLIDGDEFINLWEQYYDKMADEDKNMLPLKRIAFLGSNE